MAECASCSRWHVFHTALLMMWGHRERSINDKTMVCHSTAERLSGKHSLTGRTQAQLWEFRILRPCKTLNDFKQWRRGSIIACDLIEVLLLPCARSMNLPFSHMLECYLKLVFWGEPVFRTSVIHIESVIFIFALNYLIYVIPMDLYIQMSRLLIKLW